MTIGGPSNCHNLAEMGQAAQRIQKVHKENGREGCLCETFNHNSRGLSEVAKASVFSFQGVLSGF